MNKVTQYRKGCVHFCNMYVDRLKEELPKGACPKVVHPYSGMLVHESEEERNVFCSNLVECARCAKEHYEEMKDLLLLEYGIVRKQSEKE